MSIFPRGITAAAVGALLDELFRSTTLNLLTFDVELIYYIDGLRNNRFQWDYGDVAAITHYLHLGVVNLFATNVIIVM